MAELYDASVARHYAAFRPPLHQAVLERALLAGRRFAVGLDVGCGTGYSAVALARHCDVVHAIDPSLAMLERAATHLHVSYKQASAERVSLPDRSVDVITFAGSVSYVDQSRAAREARRLCRPEGCVVCYDFEVQIGDLLARWDVAPAAADSKYDHAANFAGTESFDARRAQIERVPLHVTASEAAHILLADAYRFACFARALGTEPFDALRRELSVSRAQHTLCADLYWTVYPV
jgi:SAM-dependent methyltransferase